MVLERRVSNTPRYAVEVHVHLCWLAALTGLGTGLALYVMLSCFVFDFGLVVQVAIAALGAYQAMSLFIHRVPAVCPICRGDARNDVNSPFVYSCDECGHKENILRGEVVR